MSHLSSNIKREYFKLKNEMLAAYVTYDAYPTKENKLTYDMFTQRWRDFCVETMARYCGDDLNAD